MSALQQRPIVILSHAGDGDDNRDSVRNLPEEARRLRGVLELAERDGLCQLIELPALRAEDLDDTFRDIRAWCHRRCGCEAWPIHGLPGSWQFGSATIFGWTFVGFEKENDMAAFCDAWEVER